MVHARTGREPLRSLWDAVEKTATCWLWRGPRDKNGYGHLRSGSRGNVRAHRLAWELTYGAIPAGLCVCHACDVRHCVRPGHLFVGTVAANNADMVAKGRHARGERHHFHQRPELVRGERAPSAKLTRATVTAIRTRYAAGEMRAALAAEYGVSWNALDAIVKRRSWGWLADAV